METIEHRVWLGFAAAVIVAAGIGWLIYLNAGRVQDDHDALARTNQTLGGIDAALASLQDVESGQRGYVITGDPVYLTQFNDGVRGVGESLPRLESLIARDPIQQQRFTSLQALASEKISFARESMAIRDSQGEGAADEFIAAGRGKAVLDETRAVVREMQRTEAERLQLHNEESDRTTRNTTILMLALAGVSLALGAVLLVAITRNLASQRRAAELNARLSATAAASNDAIVGIDLDGSITQWNTGAERIFGYSPAEAVGRHVSFLVPSDQADLSQSNLALMRQGAGVVDQDRVVIAKDGSRIDVSLSTFPVYDASGAVSGSGAVIRDMTERKRAEAARRQMEEALRASEERFRSVVETAADAILITDRLGNIEVLNAAAEKTFGFAASEVIGRNVSMLVPSPQKEEHDGHIAAFLAKGTSEIIGMSRTLVGQRKNGSVFPHEIVVNAMHLGDDLKFTAIIRDITAAKQMENELREAKEAAEEANSAKSAFLSRMSHELRTPLNVVLGFSQVLKLDPLEPQQAEAVDYIIQAGRHLLELIDEVLDISRIEAGRLSLSIEPVHADELLADVLRLMRPLASERRITIGAELDVCDCFIVADRQRMRQVLLNLLANAIKYNREGGTVEVRCARSESALRIMVTDTGLGIAADKIGRLFVAFDRLGAEATAVEGTGLGLALSKRLVEAMGGAIGVESTVDVGSTFWIELPLTEAPAHPPEEVLGELDDGRPQSSGQRLVLYIEDNLANLNLMERILVGRLGFRLLAAMQGSLGLDLAGDHHPDLILLDLHLPDMSGSEVLQRLQHNPATRDIPVVVVSADATQGQVARLRAAGARAYITKPVDLKELLELVDSLFPDAN